MAGSISLSLSQQFDSLGKPLSGGLLYTYAAGTTNPQSAYQDVALTIPWPNPITLDGAGRVPPFYLADGQIKIRLTDKLGILQIAADNLLVVGASSGTGTPPSVDATTLIQTGWIQPIYGVGPVTGFVRANARTIGNAASGATERANADTANLFAFLYQQDTSLVVSGGRGASAAADYAANKTIALPDARGKAIFGLDGMGNSLAGILGSGAGSIGGNSDKLGFKAGAEVHTLSSPNQLPAHTHANTLNDPGHTHHLVGSQATIINGTGSSIAGIRLNVGQDNNVNTDSQTTGITITNAAVGASAAFDSMSPAILMTIYIKL